MKVWKLIRPGLHRHLSLSGMYIYTYTHIVEVLALFGIVSHDYIIRVRDIQGLAVGLKKVDFTRL